MRILIVEDEVKTASFLQKGLEEEGYTVECAFDGDEGLRCALAGEFDLMILDVMLPGRDGWSIVTELRKAGRSSLALFLTARDAIDDRVKGLDLGADAYLSKPFAFSELKALVRSLLRRNANRSQPTVFEIDGLTIDPLDHVARRDGRVLDLTPKEFALLLLLARRKGEILTRATISEQIWNIRFDTDSNSVDVHIRRLRSKVDDPWPKKLIKTVRGVGYTIEDG